MYLIKNIHTYVYMITSDCSRDVFTRGTGTMGVAITEIL